jgi:hypothetical protein
MTTRVIGKWVLLPIVSLLVLAGCGRANPFRAVERSIEAELPRLIGPADRYQVAVSRSGSNLVAGRIPWIEIHGRNVRAIEGLTMDELEVRLEGVRFDRGDRTVEEIARSRFAARIGAASVTRFVRQRSPSLRDVRIRFARGNVQVNASPALLGMGVPVEVTGQPRLRGGKAIDFDASRIAVVRLGLPEFAVARIEERINPLVDLTGMPFPIQLTDVLLEGDRVVVAGNALLNPADLRSGAGT